MATKKCPKCGRDIPILEDPKKVKEKSEVILLQCPYPECGIRTDLGIPQEITFSDKPANHTGLGAESFFY